MVVEREKILMYMASFITRDDGTEFTNMDRLYLIKLILAGSGYEIISETGLSVVYKKKQTDLSDNIVLLSTHVDCVPGITKPGFKVTKKGNYKGSFDNAATNAAVVISMLENRLSDNTVVAFTGDEEGHDNGAKQVRKLLNGKRYIAIALDVTFNLESEDNSITTYKDVSYTIDNICSVSSEEIVKKLFRYANEKHIRYMVTRASGKYDFFEDREDEIKNYYDVHFEVESVAAFDEAIEYSESDNCVAAFSLCLPTDDDDEDDPQMHTNKKVKIKKESFNEYIEALTYISGRLSCF